MTYPDHHQGENVIVTAAMTGGIHGREVAPNLSERPDEIARDARACERLDRDVATPDEAREMLGIDDRGR